MTVSDLEQEVKDEITREIRDQAKKVIKYYKEVEKAREWLVEVKGD